MGVVCVIGDGVGDEYGRGVEVVDWCFGDRAWVCVREPDIREQEYDGGHADVCEGDEESDDDVAEHGRHWRWCWWRVFPGGCWCTDAGCELFDECCLLWGGGLRWREHGWCLCCRGGRVCWCTDAGSELFEDVCLLVKDEVWG